MTVEELAPTPESLRGARVLILGLGILNGGASVAEYCASHGAILRITDLRNRDVLVPALAQLSDVDATYVLGQNREEDIDWADIVFRNPGVRPDNPLLTRALERGKVVDMELAFFVRNSPALTYGVTGTKGKTTVTSMLHTFLESSGQVVRVAGNMGTSAIDLLDGLSPEDEVLLEMSSYQLEGFERAPGRVRVAIVTNVGDDHLDRYRSIAEYARVKSLITAGQRSTDWLVIPHELLEAFPRDPSHPGRLAVVSRTRDDWHRDAQGENLKVALIDRQVVMEVDGDEHILVSLDELSMRGEHNEMNAALAAVAAHLAGRTRRELQSAVAKLAGVPHRFEHVRWIDEVEFINDTAATAPVAVVAAIEALDRKPVALIAGGHDKAADYAPMLQAVRESGSHLVLLPGTGTDRLLARANELDQELPFELAQNMEEAVQRAQEAAQREGLVAVLLAPGCASFGLFVNEFDRGAQFIAAVERLD